MHNGQDQVQIVSSIHKLRAQIDKSQKPDELIPILRELLELYDALLQIEKSQQ